MKLPAIKLSKPRFPQSVKGRVSLAAAAIVVLAGGVYAATPLPTGSIEVRTYDVTGGIKEPLGNVEVQVNSVDAPYECNDPIKVTPPGNNPNHGYVKYVNCESAVYSKPNRKYLKYTIIKATRDGYQVSQKSKFKVGANKSSSRGGSFAVRKNRTTKVEISLEREGVAIEARAVPVPTTPGQLSQPASAAYMTLKQILENPKTSSGVRFGVRDNLGIPLETLKIIQNPQGGYLGIYHNGGEGTRQLFLATSPDLATWTRKRTLATGGVGQGTLGRQPNGAFVVIFEREQGTCNYGGQKGNCLNFLRYDSIDALLSGSVSTTFQANRQQSVCGSFGGNEGTPNIYSITDTTIDVGFHYFRECKFDRQARGTLTNFGSWSSRVETNINAQFELVAPTREILGDRDGIIFNGSAMALLETQGKFGDHSTWKPALYEFSTNHFELLNVNIGSKSIANPTVSLITLPSGGPALVATYYIFAEGSVSGEAGEAIFYKEL